MEVKFIQKKKKIIELEFDDKTLPNALAEALSENEVDSYVYEPHPLIKGYRLHVEADDAMKELKSAVSKVEKRWDGFSELLRKGLVSEK
ncbi:MAG: hypothetical protein JW778_08240 [Candidatus Altiarchaeota archaeon]|nr:hypothetical protein [Candidatus Altiarchaeota archaeon]